jgi:hypothetical protein
MIKEGYGARFILDRYAEGVSSIQNRISDFWMNHAFLLGHQWVDTFEDNQVREVPSEPGRDQITINRMWPAARIIVSKLTQRELSFEVPPSGADDGSVRGARIAESLLRATRRDHRWEEMREKIAWTTLKGGTGAISIDWDPDATHPNVGPKKDSSERTGGDTVEQVLSIAEFVVEPGVRDAETARWWIKAQSLPPETVRSIYNLDETPAADVTAGTSSLHRKLISTAGLGTDSAAGGSDSPLTLVLTYYERPNLMAPNGRISVVVGGEIVEGENPEKNEELPWPFPFKDKLNLVVTRETLQENEWTGQTVFSQARGVQAAFNAAWTSIIEHLRKVSNIRIAITEESADLYDELTDRPGEIVKYRDGSNPPFFLNPAQLPAWHMDLPINLANEMDDILGVHEISRGAAPPNIESGFGLSILAEQDSTPVGKMSKEIAIAFSKIGEMTLEIMEQEVKGTRETQVAEDGQPPMTTAWKGSDLLGQTNATVPLETIVPRNRAAQLQLAKDLQAGGLIQSFDQFAAVAELADGDQILEKLDPDTARARRENHAFRAGRGAHTATYDNHEIHIREHNVFRKSAAYEMLTEEEREVVDIHIQAHATEGAEEQGELQARGAIGGPALASAPTANEIPIPDDLQAFGIPDLGTQPPSGDTIPDVGLPPLI